MHAEAFTPALRASFGFKGGDDSLRRGIPRGDEVREKDNRKIRERHRRGCPEGLAGARAAANARGQKPTFPRRTVRKGAEPGPAFVTARVSHVRVDGSRIRARTGAGRQKLRPMKPNAL